MELIYYTSALSYAAVKRSGAASRNAGFPHSSSRSSNGRSHESSWRMTDGTLFDIAVFSGLPF